MIEFNKDNTFIADLEITDALDGVTCALETYFDVDEKFGTHTADDDDTWVNVYVSYFPINNDEIVVEYHVDAPRRYYDFNYYKPTEDEKHFLIDLIENYVMRIEQKSVSEMLEEYKAGMEDRL